MDSSWRTFHSFSSIPSNLRLFPHTYLSLKERNICTECCMLICFSFYMVLPGAKINTIVLIMVLWVPDYGTYKMFFKDVNYAQQRCIYLINNNLTDSWIVNDICAWRIFILNIKSHRMTLKFKMCSYDIRWTLTCCWFSLWECRRAWIHSLVSWKACLCEPSAG